MTAAAEELAARWRSYFERAPKEEPDPKACRECGSMAGEICSRECRFNNGLPTGEGSGL